MSDKNGLVKGGAKNFKTPTNGDTPFFQKLDGVSRESYESRKKAGDLKSFEKAKEISGKENDPHGGRDNSLNEGYKDHGTGKHPHWGEKEIMREDKINKGKVYKNGPRHTSESTEIEDENEED